jgi:carbon-monoxide dehydrogenase large subunit
MSILGTRVVRIEDPRFLKGEGTYIGNLPMEGALHLTFVRSPIAHARITGFDASEALSMPGVRAVWTAADIDLPPAPPAHGFMNKGIVFPYLAIDTVRYVGDLVAIVVSEDKTLSLIHI